MIPEVGKSPCDIATGFSHTRATHGKYASAFSLMQGPKLLLELRSLLVTAEVWRDDGGFLMLLHFLPLSM